MTVSSLAQLLDDTKSPRPLLRHAFWRLHPSYFFQALKTQFWQEWSADEVWPGLWIGNKGAALKVGKEGGLEMALVWPCQNASEPSEPYSQLRWRRTGGLLLLFFW